MKLNSVFSFRQYLIATVLLFCLTIVVKPSPILFEGDILIEQDVKQIDNIERIKRAAVRRYMIWDYGVIPYVIDENSGFTEAQMAGFKEAMHEWEDSTCIKFVERNEHDHDYFFRFTKSKLCDCCSYGVGKQWSLKYTGQDLSIGNGCHNKGIILHELGHVIGFWHEHQRPDRDDYVEIQYENIMENQEGNFNKLTAEYIDSLGEPYDYESIMHYKPTTFSKHYRKPTIISKNVDKNGKIRTIGQRGELTPGDIRQTNKMYNCRKCGKAFRDKSATFTSPNYHTRFDKEFQCEWSISIKDGEQIQLHLLDLDIFESNDCHDNYLEIRDGYWHKSTLLGRFCGTSTNIPIILSTGNRITINYVTNKPEHRGFAASYDTYDKSLEKPKVILITDVFENMCYVKCGCHEKEELTVFNRDNVNWNTVNRYLKLGFDWLEGGNCKTACGCLRPREEYIRLLRLN